MRFATIIGSLSISVAVLSTLVSAAPNHRTRKTKAGPTVVKVAEPYPSKPFPVSQAKILPVQFPSPGSSLSNFILLSWLHIVGVLNLPKIGIALKQYLLPFDGTY